jgi:hypothetical protein
VRASSPRECQGLDGRLDGKSLDEGPPKTDRHWKHSDRDRRGCSRRGGSLRQSGRPDLNRGPHRPELWAKFWVVVRDTWKSADLVVAAPPRGFADLAVDPRGLGSEIELLPNGDVADGGRAAGP